MLQRHPIGLSQRTPLLAGIEERTFVDIDSLLRPVYGHQKQGESYGHAEIAGRALLHKGLSPLVTALSTAQSAPVIAEMRLRAGRAGSGRGTASQLRSAITTARVCGVSGKIMVRADSAVGNKAVIRAATTADIEFSLVMTRNPRIARAIDDHAWTLVFPQLPGPAHPTQPGVRLLYVGLATNLRRSGSSTLRHAPSPGYCSARRATGLAAPTASSSSKKTRSA